MDDIFHKTFLSSPVVMNSEVMSYPHNILHISFSVNDKNLISGL